MTSTPVAQRGDLVLEADTAVDGNDPLVADLGQLHDDAEHLVGELTGGDEDQPAGAAGLRAPDPLEERQAERQGLARAGLGLAADVAAGEAVGDGQGLDGKGSVDALGGIAATRSAETPSASKVVFVTFGTARLVNGLVGRRR